MPQVSTKRAKRRNTKRGDTTKAEVSRFAGDAYDLGRRALKGVAYLKNLINIETKYIDFQVQSAISTTPTVVNLSAIAQGIDQSQRVGNSIKLQTIEFNYYWLAHGSAFTTMYRVLLIRDNERTTTDPTLAKVLQDVTGTNFAISPYHFTALQSQRFGILYDSSGMLNIDEHPTELVRFSMPHNGHVKYTGAATTDNEKGSLLLMVVSNEATNTPTFTYKARITYTDD